MSKAECHGRRDTANPDDDVIERICEDHDFIGAFIRNRDKLFAPDEDGSGFVRMLLDGFLDLDDRGLIRREYLRKADEVAARQVLAHMLREDRLRPELRCMLADLLDAKGASERRLDFSFRRRGTRTAHEAAVQMMMVFEKHCSSSKTAAAAIEAIVERFGVDESTVKKALSRVRKSRANMAAARGNK
jgi:hypothetical protein